MGIARRGVLAMSLASLFSGWAWTGKAASRSFASVAEFRDFVMAAYRRRHGVTRLTADSGNSAKFEISIGEWSGAADVSNLFAYIKANPEENVDTLVGRFVNSTFEEQARAVEDSNIVAVIRSRDYVDAISNPGTDILHEALGADLMIVYMADRPDSMSPLSSKDLPDRDLASIRLVALENLRRWLPKVVADGQFGSGTLYYVEENTLLSPSLILLDDFWKSISARFPGNVLIALPRKDQLFVFDDDGSATSQAAVRRLIAATYEDGFNLLSPVLYARRGRKIVALAD